MGSKIKHANPNEQIEWLTARITSVLGSGRGWTLTYDAGENRLAFLMSKVQNNPATTGTKTDANDSATNAINAVLSRMSDGLETHIATMADTINKVDGNLSDFREGLHKMVDNIIDKRKKSKQGKTPKTAAQTTVDQVGADPDQATLKGYQELVDSGFNQAVGANAEEPKE